MQTRLLNEYMNAINKFVRAPSSFMISEPNNYHYLVKIDSKYNSIFRMEGPERPAVLQKWVRGPSLDKVKFCFIGLSKELNETFFGTTNLYMLT